MAFGKKVDRLPLHRRQRNFPLWAIGIITLVIILAVFFVGKERHALQADLASGKTVRAQFGRQYLLLKDQTKVKVAGVPVGVVTGVKHNRQGALVTMKLFGSNKSKLGTDPSAELRIGSLLGGISYVQLTPGGEPGSPARTIPITEQVNGKTVTKTTTPVYVDSILSSVPPPAQQGAKTFVKQFQQTFANGGLRDTQQVLASSPGALRPSAGVLQALQGDQPGDLTQLVTNLERTDATVAAKQGQVEQVVDGLGSVSQTLGDNAGALRNLAATLPSDLADTRAGLTALDTTLHEVDQTAAIARPSIQELGKLIDQAQPTLVLANPVLNELNPLLASLDPVLNQLVPTSTELTNFLGGLQGTTINKLNTIVPELTKTQTAKDEKTKDGAGPGPANILQAAGGVAIGLDGVTAYSDSYGHYVPVIAGFSEYSAVPSSIPRDQSNPGSGLQPTDSCGDGTGGQGLGACPGTNPSGDETTAGGTVALPKNVTPPGLQP